MRPSDGRTIHLVEGDGWCILSSHVPKMLPVWVPVPNGLAIVGRNGGYALPAFTTREGALAAGAEEPRLTDLRSVEKEGRRNGIAINPGSAWAGGIAPPMRELPVDFTLVPQPRSGSHPLRLLELFPDSTLFSSSRRTVGRSC